jgi:hypothetical protein
VPDRGKLPLNIDLAWVRKIGAGEDLPRHSGRGKLCRARQSLPGQGGKYFHFS